MWQRKRWIGLLCLLFVQSNWVFSSNLEAVQQVGLQKIAEGIKSQQAIEGIVTGNQDRLLHYRSLLKQIEGLRAYNQQLTTQIDAQNKLLERFDRSIAQAALIGRQMLPLIQKMTTSLAKFIELDMPFNLVERRERMAGISASLLSADIDVAEKFRQVLEAYQIENEYGRKVDSYQAIIELNGKQQVVDILRVGRIALLCQSKDKKTNCRWNANDRKWQIIENARYRTAIDQGIKMAKKQAPIDILTLPVSAPSDG